jgi:hypothetical protein
MPIRVSDLFPSMLKAARESLEKDWPKAKDYAEPELKKLAQSLVDIAKLTALGKVNPQQAAGLLQIHRNATMTVLLTIEGLGLIAVENALNSALSAVRQLVNAAAGIRLL